MKAYKAGKRCLKSVYMAVLTTFLTLIFFSECNTTEPPIDNTEPGRRDYVWTVDTLYSPNNQIIGLWGTTPDDIWAIGPGGITAYDRLWHFDGEKWSPYKHYVSVFPECIYGFSKNDIWIAGSDGKIFRYNGSSWTQNYVYTKEDVHTVHINDIWGESPSDIYVLGTIVYELTGRPYGFVLHYDGTTWTEKFISKKPIQFLRIQKENNITYLSGIAVVNIGAPDTLFFHILNNNSITEIFKKPVNEVTWISLNQIGDETYFLIDQDLCRYTGFGFTKVISFSEENFSYHASGRNMKDIFLWMTDGIAHYNGSDVEYLYSFPNITSIYTRPLIMEHNVFFAAHDYINNYNLILQGKLTTQ